MVWDIFKRRLGSVQVHCKFQDDVKCFKTWMCNYKFSIDLKIRHTHTHCIERVPRNQSMPVCVCVRASICDWLYLHTFVYLMCLFGITQWLGWFCIAHCSNVGSLHFMKMNWQNARCDGMCLIFDFHLHRHLISAMQLTFYAHLARPTARPPARIYQHQSQPVDWK